MATDDDRQETSDVDFFGVKLKVNNPRLAALLNSSVTDDVQVVGRRARDVVAPEAMPARAASRAAAAEDAAGEATGSPAPD